MKIIFVSGILPASLLIKALTWSKWSHCGVILDDGHVIEAEMLKGVCKTPIKKFIKRYTNYEIVEFNLPDEQAAINFIESQIGKGYDYGYLFSFLIRRNWSDLKKWACSEVVSMAAKFGGLEIFREGYDWRITPEDLYKIKPDRIVSRV